MDPLYVLFLFICFVWILPIIVAHHIGTDRNRSYGWAYGLLLGWLGVLIVACTGYLPSEAERRVRELEAQQKLTAFERSITR